MKKHVLFFLRYILFWLILFFMMRALFLVFNTKLCAAIPLNELLMSFIHGIRLDLSMTGYLSVIPLFIWLIAQFVKGKWSTYVFNGYVITILILIVAISFIDAQLYGYWAQKLNAYASSFAKFPKEMFSFSSGIAWGKLLLLLAVVMLFSRIVFKWVLMRIPQESTKPAVLVSWFVLMLALLFLMIRGNIGMSPINQSFAYYSDKPFLNHAAVNTTWNFMASLTDGTEDEKINPYKYMDNEVADSTVNVLLNWNDSSSFVLSEVKNPDIIVVILEGWAADVVGFCGGEEDVTPNFNHHAQQALTYANFYASGNRTDKGLAAIISAQPALAKSSIINKLQKFNNLHAWPKSLQTLGYSSTFVYGGESEFANMKAYWLNSGYTNIVDIHAFNKQIKPESWGVHDDELFDKLLQTISATPSPKLITALTLSSHEPYRVPHASKFNNGTESDKYRNSVHFADSCLGVFLTQVQQQAWYNNSIIVILSDHSHQEPKQRSAFEPQRFHIPFMITGGALNPALKGVSVKKVAQQMDVVPSMLQQLNLNPAPYRWGNNLFDTTSNHFAFYTFNDGVGLVTDSSFVVFDHESKRVIMANTTDTLQVEQAAKAYQQAYYTEYLNR